MQPNFTLNPDPKQTSPFDIHSKLPPNPFLNVRPPSSFQPPPKSHIQTLQKPPTRPSDLYPLKNKAPQEASQKDQRKTVTIINKKGREGGKMHIFNQQQQTSKHSVINNEKENKVQTQGWFNWSPESRKEGTLEMSPIRQIGRQTFSHNTVDQLINKFEQSLSPLRPQPVLQTQEWSQSFGKESQKQYKAQLEQKEKEIKFLRLELQRYQRCENINKEKQVIYERLVRKLNNDFCELKNKTEKNQQPEIQEQTYQAANFQPFCPETNRQVKGQIQRNLFSNIKTPFHLIKESDSIHPSDEQQDSWLASPTPLKNDYYISKKQPMSSKAMTFNAHKHSTKQAVHHTHKKRVVSSIRGQIYQHNYHLPASGSAKMAMADKLSQINKKIQEKAESRASKRALSFAEHHRTRIDSCQSLLGLY